MPPEMRRLTLRISKQIAWKFKLLCDYYGVSMSETAEKLIQRYNEDPSHPVLVEEGTMRTDDEENS